MIPKFLRHRPHRERIGHIRNAHLGYEWDVSKLPDGFYDLRFVTSDGFHYYEYVVVGLKVIRLRPGGGGGERNLGTPGRNLLAETDMEIPLFGYDASIARSYDSYDTLAPGDFGYGWRMRKFGVGVERVELPNVRGEAVARGPLPGDRCGNDEGVCPQIPGKGFRLQVSITRSRGPRERHAVDNLAKSPLGGVVQKGPG
jgi:hypothetical protein